MPQPHHAGRHFLQIPGPTNVPDRVLRAIDNPTIDHRGPSFGVLGLDILAGLKQVFQTDGPVIIYPASGTGAWEAALTNTLSPGDTVLMCRTGWFASLWNEMALRLGLEPIFIETDWRRGADVEAIGSGAGARPGAQDQGGVRGAQRDLDGVRLAHRRGKGGDECGAASGAAAGRHDLLACLDRLQARCVGGRCHHRGVAEGADAAARAELQRGQCESVAGGGDGEAAAVVLGLAADAGGEQDRVFSLHPGTNLLFGLQAAVQMLLEEGLVNVFARHDRFAEATRRAVRAWGLEIQCVEPRHYSSSLTAVRLPDGHSADGLRAVILEKFNMSLGNGLGILKDRVFRIGHLGDLGDLQLIGTLGGVEMGLRAAGVPHKPGGVQAAIDYLAGNA